MAVNLFFSFLVFLFFLPFSALFFLFSSGSINLKASKLPTNWGVRHIYIYIIHIYIYAYNLIRWATLRLQKVKKKREWWKNKAREGKDEKVDKTLNVKKTHTKCGFFLGHVLLSNGGNSEILTFFWPTDWGYGHIYIYIYIYACAVELLSGSSLGFSTVTIWAKFVFLTLFAKTL